MPLRACIADPEPIPDRFRIDPRSCGLLRLCLPDLIKGVRAYERGDRNYFLVPDEDAKSLGAKLVTQLIWYGYSRTLFTHEFIEEMLLKAGFSRVVRCAYRQTSGPYPEIVDLDNREPESLYVEAYNGTPAGRSGV